MQANILDDSNSPSESELSHITTMVDSENNQEENVLKRVSSAPNKLNENLSFFRSTLSSSDGDSHPRGILSLKPRDILLPLKNEENEEPVEHISPEINNNIPSDDEETQNTAIIPDEHNQIDILLVEDKLQENILTKSNNSEDGQIQSQNSPDNEIPISNLPDSDPPIIASEVLSHNIANLNSENKPIRPMHPIRPTPPSAPVPPSTYPPLDIISQPQIQIMVPSRDLKPSMKIITRTPMSHDIQEVPLHPVPNTFSFTFPRPFSPPKIAEFAPFTVITPEVISELESRILEIPPLGLPLPIDLKSLLPQNTVHSTDHNFNILRKIRNAQIRMSLRATPDEQYKNQFENPRRSLQPITKKSDSKKIELKLLEEFYKEMVNFLIKSDCNYIIASILSSLVQPTDVDRLSKIWRKCFAAQGGTVMLDVIYVLISREVNENKRENTIFRGNSFPVVFLSVHARCISNHYLRETVLPVIDLLRNSKLSYEINPLNLQQTPDSSNIIEKNKENLLQALNLLINGIFQSIANVPLDIRKILYFIKKEKEKKFPNSTYSSISGFFFLRLMCPALVSPEGFDIVDVPLTQEYRRPLILISKCLQNLSNNAHFHEDYMTCFNSWIDDKQGVMVEFLKDLSEEVHGNPMTYFNYELDVAEYRDLVNFFEISHQALTQQLYQSVSPDEASFGLDAVSNLVIQICKTEEKVGLRKKKKVGKGK